MRTSTDHGADAPADTRMMRIVHDAIRRDLGRARAVLAETSTAPPGQRRAVARHLGWLVGFLAAHHRSEDEGLYPLVRRRDASAASLLAAMHADHEAIAAAAADVEAAAMAAEADPTAAGDRLAAAVDGLALVLLPHLQREEDDMMPVVSSAVTAAEWRAVEEQYNLAPKSFRQLGYEGHWLIDGATPDDRATVLSLVPPVPRFVLLHGFARSYRRRASACWSPAHPPRRVQGAGRCEVQTEAPIEAVWEVVRDVTRVGEWSHECVGVRWLDGAVAAEPGARFRGRNRAGVFRWGRVCEIVRAEPYELVWRTVSTALFPDSTEWAIRLRPTGEGTAIEQTFTVVRAPKVLAVAYALLIPGHRDRDAALTADLQRLAAIAGSRVAVG
jgi:hypothetical protein